MLSSSLQSTAMKPDDRRKAFLPDRIVNIEFATLFTVTVRFPRRNIRNVFYCFVRLLCL